MVKMVVRVTILGIFLAGTLEANAQFAPFDNPPIRGLLRGLPQVQTSERLSDRPTIKCSNLRNSVAQILCSGRDGAAADWAVNSAIGAYLHHLGEAGKAAFEAEQTEWRNSIVQRCSLPVLFDPTFAGKREANCVFRAFQERARQIRSRLPPQALAEVNLTPEQRASIQQRLIDNGFLTGTADGEFGLVTREAIKQHQISQGLEPTGFLSQLSRSSSSDERLGAPQSTKTQLSAQSGEQDVSAQNQDRSKLIELQRVETDLKNRLAEAKARQEAAENKVVQLAKEFQTDVRAAKALSDKQVAELEASRKALNDAKLALQASEQQIKKIQSSATQTQSKCVLLILGLGIFSIVMSIVAAGLYRRLRVNIDPPEKLPTVSPSDSEPPVPSANDRSHAWLYKKVPLRLIVAVSVVCATFVAYREYSGGGRSLSCSETEVIATLRKILISQHRINAPEVSNIIKLGNDVTTDKIDQNTGTLWCSITQEIDFKLLGELGLKEGERAGNHDLDGLFRGFAAMSQFVGPKRISYKVQPMKDGKFYVTSLTPPAF